MLTAQEAKERTERATHIKKNLEFNKSIALIEEEIENAVSKGNYKCIAYIKITDNLYTKDEKKLFKEKIEQTIASLGYKIGLERGASGPDNNFYYDFYISWERA